jgi:integrase
MMPITEKPNKTPYTSEDFKRPIIRQRTRILRPNEFKALLNHVPKTDHQTMLQVLLFTGMRYVELQRFQNFPSWFDGDFIHLPKEACHKKERTQQERWVRLNQQGKMVVRYFKELRRAVPTSQSWNMNIKKWGSDAGLDPEGLCVKTTRKTWESWLMFYYPPQVAQITLSQGHTQITSLQHYVNMPFTEVDKLEMRNYVEGWI